MPSGSWWPWMVLAAAFLIGEIFTAGFFIFWFGIGAAVAGVLAILGLSLAWQWISFVVVSTLLLLVSRKFAQKVTREQPPGIGADRYAGKQGMVLEEIDNDKDSGTVRIEEETWRATSQSGAIIEAGLKIRVCGQKGTHLIVTKMEEAR